MNTDSSCLPASPWWSEGTPELWLAAFHDGAAELFATAPWSVVPDATCRLFVLPEYGKPRSPLVAVIGQDGGPCGLRLFSDLEAHRVWLEATANADAERGPTLPRHVALDFVAGAELADDVRTRIIANGWTVADDRAWPILRVTGTDGSVGKPPGGDVPAYEIILRAVTAALAEPEPWLRAWRDDDRHEATLHVDTSEDAFEVRVDTAAPEFMRLFDGDDAALLAAFERLDWSDGIEGVDGDRLATLERTLIARMRARSPELLPERPHAGIELLLAAGDWFGKPVTGLSAANVEYVVRRRARQAALVEVGHPACASSQGFTTTIPHPSKSPTLRVATAAPRARAVAAIWQSGKPMGRPAALRSAKTAAKATAAGPSKGRTRCAKSSATIASTASASASRRRPPGRIATPRRSSASVTALMWSSPASRRPNQSSTARFGATRISSETTFVSITIIGS